MEISTKEYSQFEGKLNCATGFVLLFMFRSLLLSKKNKKTNRENVKVVFAGMRTLAGKFG